MPRLKLSAQEGQALTLTLIILGLSVLLIPIFLVHISTNLLVSRSTEERLKEQYAADSGVEYALWQLQHGVFTGTTGYGINNKAVDVTWGLYTGDTYQITSTARGGDGSSTTIEAYVSLNVLDFSWLFGSAITSPGQVIIQPGSVVIGGVRCYTETLDNKGTIDYWEPYPITETWPTTETLSSFYKAQVPSDPYPDSTIDVNNTPYISPLYRVGNLNIISSRDNVSGVLSGTVYVAGDLNVGMTNKDFTLDLNGQTIYAEGNINFGTKCTIRGSGCIIAQGNIQFQPHVDSDPNNFVFIMSTGGTSTIQPGDSLYGAIAGSATVQLQPNCFLELTALPESGLNFPDGDVSKLRIHSYIINPWSE